MDALPKVKNVLKGLIKEYDLEEINIIDTDRVIYSGNYEGWVQVNDISLLLFKKHVMNMGVIKKLIFNNRKAFIFVGNPCKELDWRLHQ